MRVERPEIIAAIERFLAECVIDGKDDAWIAHEMVYRAFHRWVLRQNYTAREATGLCQLGTNAIGYVMCHLPLKATKHRYWVGKRRLHGWRGLWPTQSPDDPNGVFEMWFNDARDGRYRCSPGQSVKSVS